MEDSKMPESKVEIGVGSVFFRGEGSENWLSGEIEKAMHRIPELAKLSPVGSPDAGTSTVPKNLGTLAAFLKLKNATTNQTKKFLATAKWLHDRDKKDRLTTGDVTKALADNQQSRLGNASDCLNKNVAKGFSEKDGNGFYVTEEGRAEVG
jgi:hypothetical protein